MLLIYSRVTLLLYSTSRVWRDQSSGKVHAMWTLNTRLSMQATSSRIYRILFVFAKYCDRPAMARLWLKLARMRFFARLFVPPMTRSSISIFRRKEATLYVSYWSKLGMCMWVEWMFILKCCLRPHFLNWAKHPMLIFRSISSMRGTILVSAMFHLFQIVVLCLLVKPLFQKVAANPMMSSNLTVLLMCCGCITMNKYLPRSQSTLCIPQSRLCQMAVFTLTVLYLFHQSTSGPSWVARLY